MALKQSKTALRRMTPPVPYQHGMIAAAIFAYTLKEAFTAASDILEIGTLPAGAQLVSVTLVGDGLTGTAEVGLMTGDPGERDDTRDLTDVTLFAAGSVADTESTASTATCLGVTPVDAHRGIGVKLSANQTAGDKTITLVMQYTL